MRFLYRLLSCIFLFSPHLRAQEYFYYQYNTRNGLPCNKVNAITQDEQNNIWIPSEKGITKFNGARFKTFTTKDKLPTNDIFFSSSKKENEVWVYGNSLNITYIKRDTVFDIPVKENIQKETQYVKPYYYDYNGFTVSVSIDNTTIIIVRNDNAYLISTKKLINTIPALKECMPASFHSDKNFISKCGVATNGKVLAIGYKGELIIYDFYTARTKIISLNAPVYISEHGDNYSHLFAGYYVYQSKDQHILRFIDLKSSSEKRIDLSKYESGYNGSTTHIIDDSSRIKITSTQNTFIEINNKLQVVETFKWSKNQKINNINKDHSGNYWLATNNEGLIFISKYLSPFKRKEFKLNDADILNIYFSDNKYFIFDRESTLYVTDTNFKPLKEIVLPVIHKSYPNISNYWFYPDGEKGYIITSAFGHYYLQKDFRIKALTIDSNVAYKSYHYDSLKRKLITANSSGLDIIDEKGNYLPIGVCRQMRVMNISQSGKSYWATNDLGRITQLDSGFNIIKDTIIKGRISFSTNHGENLIFVIEDYGIYYYDFKKNLIKVLLKDDNFQYYKRGKSGIWIGNINYILLLSTKNNDWSVTQKYLNLGGLLYNEIYNIAECGKRNYLLCDNGLIQLPDVSFNYENNTSFINSAYLSSVTISENKVVYFDKSDSSYTYKYVNKNLTLDFTCNSTSFLGNISYKYLIEGHGSDWISSNSGIVNYPPLSPGTYKLHLKGCVNNLSLETKTHLFTLIVKPLWWQTVVFKSVVFTTIVSLIFLMVFLWVRKIKRHERWKANLYKKNAALELSALQSQMNPHFFFNSLTSLQSFIKSNKTDKAERLLHDFSKLVRLYLEFSRSTFISLEEELESLKLYTNIEEVRFSSKFRVIFKIRNSHGFKLGEIRIPPMLIQPFVENAIKHGLRHVENTNGTLKIYFLISSRNINVIIDDNGIGRKKSKQISNQQFASYGNTLIKDRIAILNESGKMNIYLQITDKFDSEGNANGTRVVLKFDNEYDKSDFN